MPTFESCMQAINKALESALSAPAPEPKRRRSKYDPGGMRPGQRQLKAVENPTKEMYDQLNRAAEAFHERLFESKMPRCLIVLQRKRGSLGYFAAERFNVRDGTRSVDEIALNPKHFKGLTTKEILGTLAHEMAHQYEFRCVSHKKKSYHDKSWANVMKTIGLFPSDTAEPGGKETGWRVSHYVIKDGLFDIESDRLISAGCDVKYVEVLHDPEREKKEEKKKKTTYTCPQCKLNVWGKPNLHLICDDCQKTLEAEGN